jgi:hypothetical protein
MHTVEYLGKFKTKYRNILDLLSGAQMGSFGQTGLSKKSHVSFFEGRKLNLGF